MYSVCACCESSLRLCLSREKDGGTEVALRVAYMLPEQLREYVGPVGVWGDVNDILEENMAAMKVLLPELRHCMFDAMCQGDSARLYHVHSMCLVEGP